MSEWSEKYTITRAAIRNGTLKRQPCERCGDPKSNAHHDDYSQPLNVNWLCQKHHIQRHKELGWGIAGKPTGSKLDKQLRQKISDIPATASCISFARIDPKFRQEVYRTARLLKIDITTRVRICEETSLPILSVYRIT